MIISLYIQIYVYLVLFYLWYRFILRFISDIKSLRTYPEINAKVSIIVPIYNEKKEGIEMCVRSLCEAYGDNEIILVDDCSTNNGWNVLKEVKLRYPQIKLIRSKQNKGKRRMQYIGLNFITGDYVVTVDSDTIIKKDAIVELLKPFNDPRVGATTGNVRAFNREYNFMTKMIDARYRNAFNFERQGLSAFGIVTCCSGVISAYKKDILLNLKEEYVNQRFLGKICTYGDDRHLTNLFIKKGYHIVYARKAIAYTEVPNSLKTYINQQVRWKKSFIRESCVILPYSLKKNYLLALEVMFNLVIPFFGLLARFIGIYLIFVAPQILIPLAISIVFMAILRNILLFIEEEYSAAVYSIPFSLLYELFVYWLYWYALFTLKDTKWGTR